jgi:SAM-dependent methyltransferase
MVEGGCVHGIDAAWPALAALDEATEVYLIQGSVGSLPYAHSSFDMIVSADVLQHLSRSDAQCALAEMERVLRPGGLALIRTNAAWGRRWLPTREDWRLYTPEGLRAEVMSAGLTVERITYANAFPSLWAAIPRPFRRNVENPVGSSYNSSRGVGIPGPSGPIRSALMSGALRLEAQWLQGAPHRVLSFGHTLFAVARKDVR